MIIIVIIVKKVPLLWVYEAVNIGTNLVYFDWHSLRLCKQIVHDDFTEFTMIVFFVLATFGMYCHFGKSNANFLVHILKVIL